MKATKKKSRSETGHVKNLMNFEDLLVRFNALGPRYTPSRPELQLGHLQQVQQEAQMVFDRLTMALTLNDTATNTRFDLFELLRPLATRIVNNLIASGVSAKTLEDARGFQRKIQGTRLSKKETDAPPAPMETSAAETAANGTENGETAADKTRSGSRLSYDLKIDHLAKLVSLTQNEPMYQPHEPDLQIGALQNFLQQLRTANTNKTYAEAELEAARSERQRVFYHPETGMVPLAMQAKAYVKAALGTTSEDCKYIQRIKFRMMG